MPCRGVSETDGCIPCLDHGFVRLIDVMGDDAAIVQAARVSYGEGTRTVSEDRGLIRYLMRHGHTSPFEMVEFKFHCKLPIFVARQWIRHRTANVNEVSGRYSAMKDEFYVPEPAHMTKQSSANKQGGSEEVVDQAPGAAQKIHYEAAAAFVHYDARLKSDMRRELARINLPLSTYTEWYWKIDMHNLLHFLRLRLDLHAQFEIRVYAEALAAFVKGQCPLAWEAFADYQLRGMRLSRLEVEGLTAILGPGRPQAAALSAFENNREREEFVEKLKRFGIAIDD